MNAKRITIWWASYSAFLLLLVFAFVRGLLSPQTLGRIGLLSMIGFGLILFLILKSGLAQGSSTIGSQSAALDPITRRKRLRHIRICKLLVLFMILSLFEGLRRMEPGSLLPTLVGVTFNLFMTYGLIYTIVRLQRSLR